MPARAHTTGGLLRWVPGVELVRGYRKAWLRSDITAGIVLTALLVPAGMGYAEAAGLPASNGLYATIVPLLAYAVFGPSRILVLGPDSTLVPLIAVAIAPVVAANPDDAIAAAGLLALFTGAICIVAGLARFGFVTDLLSGPVRYGYLNGIALTVIVSQIPKLLGFSTGADDFLEEVGAIVDGLAEGEADATATVIGVAAVVLILVLRVAWPKIPGVLLAVVGAMVAVPLLDLNGDLPVVGELPRGLPGPSLPTVPWEHVPHLFGAAVGIAIVAFADTSVLSRTFAIRGGYRVDANQELVALGLANVATGLFQGFSVCSSSTRTPVAESAGARTQLTGVVGAVLVMALLVLVPGVFRNLPETVLAAVVITAAIRLFEIRALARLATLAPSELVLSQIAFLGVVLLGVLPGIGLAVAMSLLNFLRRAWRPHDAVLVRVDGVKGYHDASRHPEGRRVPGLLLYRFDAPLFFANAEYFREQVVRLVDSSRPRPRWVVITAEPITSVDATAVDMLYELLADLERRHVVLAFAELKGHVRERLQRYGFVRAVGPERFYRTIGEAVKAYVAEENAAWTDWEDRAEPSS